MTISKENSKNHTHTEVKKRNPAAHILMAWLPPGTPESGSVPPPEDREERHAPAQNKTFSRREGTKKSS